MTKEQAESIIKKENELHLKYLKSKLDYVKNRFPFGYGFEKAEKEFYAEYNSVTGLLQSWWILFDRMTWEGIFPEPNVEIERYEKQIYNWLEGRP